MASSQSTSGSGFVVYIYESEIDVIHKYAADARHRVGDLFGLWTHSGSVAVHIAETSVRAASVEQKLEEDLKKYVVEKHMLCHIGKWQCDPAVVTSTNPGELSRTTVGSYCGQGKGYETCVLLSFCDGNGDIQPFLFQKGGTEYESATLKILSGNKSSDEISDNPFRNVPAIREMLEKRKSIPSATVTYIGESENTRPGSNTSSLEQTRQSSSDCGNLISLNSSTSPQCESISLSLHQPSPESQISGLHPSTCKPPTFLTNSAGEKILEEVLKEISNMVEDPQKVDVQRILSSGHIQLKFEIKGAKYEIVFPKTFPEAPAMLSRGLQPDQLDLKPSNRNEKLQTAASILFTLGFCSGVLHQQLSTEPSTTSDCDMPSSKLDDGKDEALVMFSREVRKNIKKTFVIFGNVVNMVGKLDKPGKRMELTFQHYNKDWLIAIPVEFPEKSARIFHVDDPRGNRRREVIRKHGQTQSISNLLEIVKVINNECSCTLCFQARKG